MTNRQQVELLAPAGDWEKLEIAVHYGADAVYLADKEFSLRNYSGNFTPDELKQAVRFAHQRGVRVYVACNIYPRNDEQNRIRRYLETLGDIHPDAVIVADPGVISAALEIIPHIPLHLSTQANTTSSETVRFWSKLGIQRVNAARELSLEEIRQIVGETDLEMEAFVHGAMCISYSGRCLLSTFLTSRDSNRGMCSQPCRWNYFVMEETRPGQYMPIAEDERGTYLFNSRDLCMIEHLPEMIAAGIQALKIEGRMKGIHYLATVVNVYRQALDAYYSKGDRYCVDPRWRDELNTVSNREYCTGFYFKDPRQILPNATNRLADSGHRFVAKVIGQSGSGLMDIEVRNKLYQNDSVAIIRKGKPAQQDRVRRIIDSQNRIVGFAQPGSRVSVAMDATYQAMDLIRRIEGEG